MWKIGEIRIFVLKRAADNKQIIARLQPIQESTIHQTLGWEGEVVKLNGYIVSEEDRLALKSLVASGTTFPLTGYGTDYGDFLVSNVNFDQENVVSQTLRTDLPCDSPVFSFTLELFEEI